jgi:hypothetical protein
VLIKNIPRFEKITEKEPVYFKRGKCVNAAEGSKLATFVWKEVCTFE